MTTYKYLNKLKHIIISYNYSSAIRTPIIIYTIRLEVHDSIYKSMLLLNLRMQ